MDAPAVAGDPLAPDARMAPQRSSFLFERTQSR